VGTISEHLHGAIKRREMLPEINKHRETKVLSQFEYSFSLKLNTE